MTNEDIDPLVPEMPRRTSSEPVVADGGRRPTYDEPEADAPVVPEC